MKLTIDYLKSLNNHGLHYFGLGFIQMKVSTVQRFHFYHPDIMPILDADEIHDHRYEFESTVEKGALSQEIFTYQSMPFSDYGLYEVSCKKEDAGKAPFLIKDVIPEKLAEFVVQTGQRYSLQPQAFHRIDYKVPTITSLIRGPILKDYARIIKSHAAPDVCPFSKKMTDDELWGIIEQILLA